MLQQQELIFDPGAPGDRHPERHHLFEKAAVTQLYTEILYIF